MNKLINSSPPSQQEKSLENNISLLKKNLCTKDELIKKLVETQNTALTTTAKFNNHHSNTLNQSSSSLPSNSFNGNSHNTEQLASQEQQDPFIARPCSSQLQEISHPTQTHHQRPEQNIAVKSIYVGNLPGDIIKQNIWELFGLNSTSYLRDACNINFPINNRNGKFKVFAFIKAPAYITDKLIKLDGIAYNFKELRVEEKDHQLEKETTITLQINIESLP